jgi:hypothetical protein
MDITGVIFLLPLFFELTARTLSDESIESVDSVMVADMSAAFLYSQEASFTVSDL